MMRAHLPVQVVLKCEPAKVATLRSVGGVANLEIARTLQSELREAEAQAIGAIRCGREKVTVVPVGISEPEIGNHGRLQNAGYTERSLVGPVYVLQRTRWKRRAAVGTESMVAIVRVTRKQGVFL